ncbi:wall 2-like isoform X3, partial [Octopus vulgaris]
MKSFVLFLFLFVAGLWVTEGQQSTQGPLGATGLPVTREGGEEQESAPLANDKEVLKESDTEVDQVTGVPLFHNEPVDSGNLTTEGESLFVFRHRKCPWGCFKTVSYKKRRCRWPRKWCSRYVIAYKQIRTPCHNCCKGWFRRRQKCIDINECTADPCGAQGTCTNTPGSYTCACSPGFVFNGTTCIDIDECSADPCGAQGTCTNNIGSYTCACSPGFVFNGITCIDIDECSADPCGAQGTCTNNIGSYTCACSPGFMFNGITCTDIDECSADPCGAQGTCTNNIGSYTCACSPGFVFNGITCIDIDECSADPCGAQGTCTNNIGSYTCACSPGFMFNGITC